MIIERALTGIDLDAALILEDVDVLAKHGLNLQCLLSTLNGIADFRTTQGTLDLSKKFQLTHDSGSFQTFIIGATAESKVHSDLHRHFPLQVRRAR